MKCRLQGFFSEFNHIPVILNKFPLFVGSQILLSLMTYNQIFEVCLLACDRILSNLFFVKSTVVTETTFDVRKSQPLWMLFNYQAKSLYQIIEFSLNFPSKILDLCQCWFAFVWVAIWLWARKLCLFFFNSGARCQSCIAIQQTHILPNLNKLIVTSFNCGDFFYLSFFRSTSTLFWSKLLKFLTHLP